MNNKLTDLEKYILTSKDEELTRYFFKNHSYPNYEEFRVFDLFDEDQLCDISSIRDFHIDHTETLELADQYFCGMRANHFAIIYGYLENDFTCRTVIILANHKGILCGECVKFDMREKE